MNASFPKRNGTKAGGRGCREDSCLGPGEGVFGELSSGRGPGQASVGFDIPMYAYFPFLCQQRMPVLRITLPSSSILPQKDTYSGCIPRH